MHENLYSKKITFTVKKRPHSRQQPCRSPRLTVIGVGLRKISSKFCLPSVRAARRHCRCLAFRLFYCILCLFSVYTFFMRNPCSFVTLCTIFHIMCTFTKCFALVCTTARHSHTILYGNHASFRSSFNPRILLINRDFGFSKTRHIYIKPFYDFETHTQFRYRYRFLPF